VLTDCCRHSLSRSIKECGTRERRISVAFRSVYLELRRGAKAAPTALVKDAIPLSGSNDDAERDEFTFAMGEHEATFPCDRRYATNHMWAKEVAANRFRFGLTAYAVRLLQDVYFLDWIVDPGTPVKLRAQIGSIESKKAESDLYCPVAGTVVSINNDALDDPSIINADTYNEGWLIEIESTEGDPLLAPDAYAEHLNEAWEVAQRTIKGQANH
jgi:glycine cleavage system H protein